MPNRERISRTGLNNVISAYRATDWPTCRAFLRRAIPDLVCADYSAEHAATTIRTGMDSTSAAKQDAEFKELRIWLAAADGIEQIPLF